MPTIFVLLLFQLAICGVFAFGGRARNTDGGFDANVGDSVDGGEKSSRTLEDSNNPFSIVDPPDITGETRPCSPTHECMHNSTCEYELLNGDPSCDCSTATSDDGNDALFAGKYCEYEATSYCDKPNDLGERHFCTNGGGCFSLDSSAGCLCPDGYSGKHCEHFNYLDYIDNDEEEVVIAEDNDVLAGADYYYEEEEQQEEQDENPVVDRDDEESVEIEYSGTPPPSHVPSSINPIHSEYQALAKFYETTSGDSWNRNDYWLSDIGICEWFGVGCNYDNSVSLLTLPSNSLTGALDLNTLRLLPNLTSLVLSDNRLFGRVDDNIGMLQKLTHLDLSQNLLHGLIPSALSDLSSLKELKLHDNRLTAFLLNDGYQNLRIIDLSNNYIQGTVQFDVARLHQLEVVRLSGNRLSGHFEKSYSQGKISVYDRFLNDTPKLPAAIKPIHAIVLMTDMARLLMNGPSAIYMTKFNSVPAFIASVTLELFD